MGPADLLQLGFGCRKISPERGIAHHCKRRYRSGGPTGRDVAGIVQAQHDPALGEATRLPEDLLSLQGTSCAKRIAADAANAACPLGYELCFLTAPSGRGRPQYALVRSMSFSTSDSTRTKNAEVNGSCEGANSGSDRVRKEKDATFRCFLRAGELRGVTRIYCCGYISFVLVFLRRAKVGRRRQQNGQVDLPGIQIMKVGIRLGNATRAQRRNEEGEKYALSAISWHESILRHGVQFAAWDTKHLVNKRLGVGCIEASKLYNQRNLAAIS